MHAVILAVTKSDEKYLWTLFEINTINNKLYTVSQKKTSHFNFRHNFAIC